MEMEHAEPRSLRPGAIAAGALLLVLGAGMLLDTTGVAHVNMGSLVAPLVLITLGVSAMLGDRIACGDAGRGWRRGRRHHPARGFWMIGLGAWMLASQTHMFGLSFATSWPLLVILAGVMIMIRGAR